MTGVDIDNMSAGAKMNIQVASIIMGYDTGDMRKMPIPCPDGRPGCCVAHFGYFFPNGMSVPPFSTDISAALTMEEEITKMPGHIQVGYVSRLYEILNIPFNKPMPLSTEESLKLIRATPEQRCRAALKAVMGVY